MAKRNITSYNQSGGITAHTISATHRGVPPPTGNSPGRMQWRRWAIAAGAIMATSASVVAVLEYFDIKPWEAALSDKAKINVTSYQQSGGITAGTVTIGPRPRHLTPEVTDQIENAIPKGAPVTITAMGPDNEASGFAFEIHTWMRENGYPAVKGPNEAWGRLPPVTGQIIEKGPGGYDIIVGSNNP